MQYLEARNPAYADAQKTKVNLEVRFVELPDDGFIPFTANPNDTEPHGRQLYQLAVLGTFGDVVAFDPATVPLPTEASAVAIRRALTEVGLRDEFEGWVPTQSFEIRDYWEYETVVTRSAPIWGFWCEARGHSTGVVDQLFVAAGE